LSWKSELKIGTLIKGRLSAVSLVLYSTGWYLSNFSLPLYPKNWIFFLFALTTSLSGIRFATFWFFLETLLFGLLKGWKIQRPQILIMKGHIVKNSSSVVEEFKEWVSHYHKIEVSYIIAAYDLFTLTYAHNNHLFARIASKLSSSMIFLSCCHQ